jgi:hypothetical protein
MKPADEGFILFVSVGQTLTVIRSGIHLFTASVGEIDDGLVYR